jgi:glycosyltransferase involved in cell wall biosynthesis
MKISVVIPTHNRREKLRRAIESVRAQTLSPQEVIVVDDGSTDGTLEMLQDRALSNLKVVGQTNRGVSAARNSGIRASKNEWVAFLDSDDWWLPGKLEQQAQFHKRFPEYLISQTDEIWIRNNLRINPKKYHRKRAGWIFNLCVERCMITPSAVMINDRVFQEVGVFDESLPACEDYDLWLRVTDKYPVGLLDAKLVVKTGGHADQLSGRYWGMDRFRVCALEKAVKNSTGIENRISALRMLVEKSSILAEGSAKRNKPDAAGFYQLKISEYSRELEHLDGVYQKSNQAG